MDLTTIREAALEIEGDNCGDLPSVQVLKREKPSAFEAVVYNPVLCLILQGSKETTAGNHTAVLRAGDALLVSHDVPVVSKITKASQKYPYVALILSIDLRILRSLFEEVGEVVSSTVASGALSSNQTEDSWLLPVSRYLAMREDPLDVSVLGPAVMREIHYRLLLSSIGGMLRQLLFVDSHASRIAKAIVHIRRDFRDSLAIPALAKTASMSVSSFHDHFKSVTGTTPLQYQKDLRMIEARDLLLSGRHSVSAAGYEVGYESATHFSRDYTRKFGAPPSSDLVAKPAF